MGGKQLNGSDETTPAAARGKEGASLAGTYGTIVHRLATMAAKRAEDSIEYYQRSAQRKRAWALRLRVFAILSGALATLTPIILTIIDAFRSSTMLVQSYLPVSAVFAAIAVGCVSFDKLFGYSSGWMRAIGTELELRARADAFEVARALEIEGSPIADRRAFAAAAARIAAFVQTIHDLTRAETQAWVVEFRGALGDIEKTLEAVRAANIAPASRRNGAIEVRVTNAAELDGQAWTVQLGEDPPVERMGASSAVLDEVPAGVAALTVRASRGGSVVTTEKAVEVSEGKLATMQVAVGG
jgi:hypothetical protein